MAQRVEEVRNRLITRLSTVLNNIRHQIESQEIDNERLDYISLQLEQICHQMQRLEACGLLSHEIVFVIERAKEQLDLSKRESDHNSYQAPCENNGRKGRPRFVISMEQLQYFIDNGFTATDMSTMLGVSKSTLQRRLREFNLSAAPRYADLSNNDLDNLVSEVQTEFPNAGYRRIDGQLRQRGILVQQHRLRESVQRTDPDGVALRWFDAIKRRTYSVAGPLCLWHIDGNHKLIRYIILYISTFDKHYSFFLRKVFNS
jgi:AraC-like DNA-binding protein